MSTVLGFNVQRLRSSAVHRQLGITSEFVHSLERIVFRSISRTPPLAIAPVLPLEGIISSGIQSHGGMVVTLIMASRVQTFIRI